MRYIGQQEVEEIIKLHDDEGWTFKDLAKRFNVCEATVSNYVNKRTSPRFLKKKGGRQRGIPVTKSFAAPDYSDQDFSRLPDHVLFEHVRECNFIG